MLLKKKSNGRVKEMATLAVSDVHIGYEKSNVKLFNSFLQERIIEGNDVDRFVILGDFVDMWRRDVSGLFLENHETLRLLLEVKKKNIPIHYIVGNHDFHLLNLKGHLYPLAFEERWPPRPLELNGLRYIFRHGYEFEITQSKIMSELLCHNLSDGAGKIRSDFWKWITSRRDVLECIKEIIRKYFPRTSEASLNQESLAREYLQMLMLPPNERLANKREVTAEWTLPFRRVEVNAAESVKEGEVLVFGHTHRPLISRDGKIANTGSWVSDEDTPYTYVEIDGTAIRLMQYDGSISQDITKNHPWP